MAKEAFIANVFYDKTRKLLTHADAILTANVEAGYTMTLRQLYYQLVQAGIIENNKQSYDRLGYLIDQGRQAGVIDWDAIEDRNRHLNAWELFRNPQHFLNHAMNRYLEDIWRDQDMYLEVAIEKDALVGVLERPCGHYRVPFMAFRGFPSSSAVYEMSKRYQRAREEGKRVVLLYLGDHDPSGISIPRSTSEKLELFCYGEGIELVRLALNMDQIQSYGLVSDQTTKSGDSKSPGYIHEFGTDVCWELDALPNAELDKIIRAGIEEYITDPEKLAERRAEELANKALLQQVANEYGSVANYFKHRGTSVFTRDVYRTADEILTIAGESDEPDTPDA